MMMPRMGLISLLASAVTAISPTEKVVQMLEGLEKETETEQATEKTNFDKYTAWCETTSGNKQTAIKEGADNEQELLSTIEAQTGSYEQLLADLRELASTKERLESEKEANLKQCSQDKRAYEATKADLDSAIGGLQAAIKTLQASGGSTSKTQSLLLLQSASSLQQSLELGEAMGFLQEPKRQELVAFLQAGKAEPWLKKEGEQYNKSDYGFQSNGIVQTLNDLEKQFTGERDALVKEWTATKAACDQTDADKVSALGETAKVTNSKDTESNALKGEREDKKAELLATRKTLKVDRAYLQDVQADCGARARDYGQRSKNRAGEIKAIQTALKVMKDTVQDLEKSVNSSFLQTSASVIQRQSEVLPSFFQHKSARASESQSATQMDQAEAEIGESRTQQAVSFLANAGVSLKSLRLSQLAFRMQQEPTAATDPLQFVKQMTENMINELQTEATAATTQKGFCDTQMMKASKERDRRFRESMSLDKKMKALDTKRTELRETIELQTSSISDMEKNLGAATELRLNESAENLKTISDSSLGGKAVDNAIAALNSYYKKAARSANRYDEATAFLQQGSQISKEDPGFEGSYAGKQNAALGVVTLMEVIRDDFERTAKETKAEEDESADKFTELKSKSRIDIESKRTSMTLNKEELSVTNNGLSSGKETLKSIVGLLDAALSALEDLKDKCVNNQMTYEERKAKREKEISDLKQAMCILDPLGVETGCETTTAASF